MKDKLFLDSMSGVREDFVIEMCESIRKEEDAIADKCKRSFKPMMLFAAALIIISIMAVSTVGTVYYLRGRQTKLDVNEGKYGVSVGGKFETGLSRESLNRFKGMMVTKSWESVEEMIGIDILTNKELDSKYFAGGIGVTPTVYGEDVHSVRLISRYDMGQRTYVLSTLSVYIGGDKGGTGISFGDGALVDYKSDINGLSSKIHYKYHNEAKLHFIKIMFSYNGILYYLDFQLDGSMFSDQAEAVEWAKKIFDGYI